MDQNRYYTLRLSGEEVMKIAVALEQLPYKDVYSVLGNLLQQVKTQDAEKEHGVD